MALTDKLTAIGDAIRGKTGKADLLTLDEMPVEIAAIETGGKPLDFMALEMVQITSSSTSTGTAGVNISNYTTFDKVKFAIWQGNSSTTSYTNKPTLCIYYPDLFGTKLIMGIPVTSGSSSYMSYIVPDIITVSGYSSSYMPNEHTIYDAGEGVLKMKHGDIEASYMLSGRGTFTFWYEEA